MNTETKIAARITENLKAHSKAFAEFVAIIRLSQSWIEFSWPLTGTNPAGPLMAGAKISLLEAGTSWLIGSNRGAAASLRTHLENSIAWLYYKDHPIEYRTMLARDEDLLLPKAVKSYLQRIDRGYEKAYAAIVATAGRPNEYYYSDVSQFVHAHPAFAALGSDVASIVISQPRDVGFLKICAHADEFLSDIYVTCYRHNWDMIPQAVKDNITKRLGTKLRKFLET
jgi:hypothetical protein